jgi:hypothetical protein
MIGGCNLNRPIREIVLGAADWEVVELDVEETVASLLPRIWGRLVKK